jgi:diacylglycerol kinase (ATP)
MIRFIYNPRSGKRGKDRQVEPLLRAFVAGAAGRAELIATQGPGHATVLAQEAVSKRYTRVIAVGGDGTLNEIAQALLYSSTALGLIPCGSGNGLARHLRLPLGAEAALKLVTSADTPVRMIDTGSVNGLPFFNVMGLGLEADVALRFNQLETRGAATYVRAAWAALRARKSERCEIVCRGHREAQDVFLLSVANSDQWGNDVRIAPGAQVDDGELDLVAIAPRGLLSSGGLAARLFNGGVLGAPGVRHWRCSKFLIERTQPGMIHTDGETHAAGASLEICAVPRSLGVLVPAAGRGFALQL